MCVIWPGHSVWMCCIGSQDIVSVCVKLVVIKYLYLCIFDLWPGHSLSVSQVDDQDKSLYA